MVSIIPIRMRHHTIVQRSTSNTLVVVAAAHRKSMKTKWRKPSGHLRSGHSERLRSSCRLGHDGRLPRQIRAWRRICLAARCRRFRTRVQESFTVPGSFGCSRISSGAGRFIGWERAPNASTTTRHSRMRSIRTAANAASTHRLLSRIGTTPKDSTNKSQFGRKCRHLTGAVSSPKH